MPNCVGYSHLESSLRCALWMDLPSLPFKSGWIGYPAHNWDLNTQFIHNASGDTGWECWVKGINIL